MSHYPSVAEIWKTVEEWAPSSLAEEWDNVGIQVGDPAASVKKLVTALDVSIPLVEFAIKNQAGMILTHHPLIFTPLRKLDFSAPVPHIISVLIKNNVALASAHTNLDSARDGVSDQLAAMLGLGQVRPLVPAATDSYAGLGRVGCLSAPMSFKDIIKKVCDKLVLPGVMAVGKPDLLIDTVAVCGGSGSSLWSEFLRSGAQLFITAEVKHSVAREAEMLGLAVMDAGHFATESPIVPVLSGYMKKTASAQGWDLEVVEFSDEKMPVTWRDAGLQG